MQPSADATVFIVDDDAGVRDALAWLLRSRRLLSSSFASAEEFEAVLADGFRPAHPCCLLLDVRMPGMSGLALFEKLAERGLVEALPVIFLTGHADVPTAVDMVKRGAFDFCEKPFSDNALVDRVEEALRRSASVLAAQREKGVLEDRLAELTERERDVMGLVAKGLPNKLIAARLNLSENTIKMHIRHILQKCSARNRTEAVILCSGRLSHNNGNRARASRSS